MLEILKVYLSACLMAAHHNRAMAIKHGNTRAQVYYEAVSSTCLDVGEWLDRFEEVPIMGDSEKGQEGQHVDES